MIRDSDLKSLLQGYNECMKTGFTSPELQPLMENALYQVIEETCTIGRKIKLKDGTFGKVRKVHGFSVQLERAKTDICTWFLIDELLS